MKVQNSKRFRLHHHRYHNVGELTETEFEIIIKSWNTTAKVYMSTGKRHSVDRSHSLYNDLEDINRLLKLFSLYTIDVLVEAKEKDLAELKFISYMEGMEK